MRRILGRPSTDRQARTGWLPAAFIVMLIAGIAPSAFTPAATAAPDQTQVGGGVSGGVPAGVPGGVVAGVPGGVAGGVPGGAPGGVPGVVGGVAGGVPGGVPGVVGGVPGGVRDGLPGVPPVPPQVGEAQAQSDDEMRKLQQALMLLQKAYEELAARQRASSNDLAKAYQFSDKQSAEERAAMLKIKIADAERTLERQQTLFKTGLTTQEAIASAEVAYVRAKLEYEQMLAVDEPSRDAKARELAQLKLDEIKAQLARAEKLRGVGLVGNEAVEDARSSLARAEVELNFRKATVARELSPEAAALRDRLPRDGSAMADDALTSLIKETAKIANEGDRAELLMAVAKRQVLTPEMVTLYVNTANTIRSEEERARVFSVPVRLRSGRGK